MNNKLTDEFYTVVEVADLLKISAQTVKRYIKNGSIKGFKTSDNHNSGYRISVEEVKKLLTRG